jgi:hypothetical protein
VDDLLVAVPWASWCEHRQAALVWVARQWAGIGHVGIRLGKPNSDTWCKAEAVANAIADQPGDILVVSDADVWTDGVAEAIQRVRDGAPWVIPHHRVRRLTEAATTDVLAGRPSNEDMPLDPFVEGLPGIAYAGVAGGGIVVLRRDVYETCPLDPRFTGWGQEDECLPEGTQILTDRGMVPIESVTTRDRVATRIGWKRVLRSWQTGWSTTLVQIVHPLGFVLCTPGHPVLVNGQFVPAMSVLPFQSLTVSRPSVSSDGQWPGEVAGGIGWSPATTGTGVATASDSRRTRCSTGPSGRPTEDPSPTGWSSTTATRTQATTASQTSRSIRSAPTRRTTAPDSCAGTTRSAASTRDATGRIASRRPTSVGTVASSSYRRLIAPTSVPVVAVNVLNVSRQPVFNLTVEDQPEFFADGVLTHNSWGLALRCLYGPPVRLSAPLWHLWHPPQPRLNRGTGSEAGLALYKRYSRAKRRPEQMRALIDEGRVPC